MHCKIAQLILTPGTKAATTSEIFVAQPDSNKEELVGKLFALIEIESKKAADMKIINFLIENLNNNYYQNEKMILRERVKTVKVEHIFESALAKTNKNLADFARAEKIKLSPKIINATVGVIYENTLYFANIGNNKAFLIYKNKNTGKYNITDIIKRSDTTEKKPQINAAKLFSNVISGSTPANGYFVFTNEALPEYLSNKQMIDITTTLPPASAAEQIKNSLSKINYYVSFLALIIKNTTGSSAAPSSAKAMEGKKASDGKSDYGEPSAQESVSNLNRVEEKTEKFLTPGGIINFKKWIGFLGKYNANKLFQKKSKKEIGAGALKDKIFFKKKTLFSAVKTAWVRIKNLFVYLINIFVYIFKIITDKEKLLEFINKIKSIPGVIKKKIQIFYIWFKNLNVKNKILFIIAAAALLLLLQNLLATGIKNEKIEKERAYTDITAHIEQKQNQAEASFLYGNENRVMELLDEIKELIDKLPMETEGQIEQYNIFEKKLNEHLERIRRVVKISGSKELANFSNLNSSANPQNIFISLDNNKIFSGDSGQKTIYSLDLTDNLITAIVETSQEIKNLKYPVPTKGDDIYYFNTCPGCSFGDSAIIQLNSKTDEISLISLDTPDSAQDIVAAAGYSNRLYLLDKKDNQIYRFNKRPSGFTDRVAWIKEKADFSDAVSLSIDGHIYVLKSNGQVLKYLKGQIKDFKLDAVEPAIEQASKILVSPELKYIYILEPSKQRLIIFDKTGDFLMQYKGDQFADLKDFAVDDPAKKIYFLDGSSVYEVEGAHFEE